MLRYSEVQASYVHPKMSQHPEWFDGRSLARRGEYRKYEDNGKKKIFIVRHAERVDLAFSPSNTFGAWMADSFDQQGNYIRKDINMPRSLPTRPTGVASWLTDAPLTTMGENEAYLVGQSMKDAGIKFDFVYSSPSYRCVQTAHHLLRGMDLKGDLIRVEPGLFEYLQWYKDAGMDFLTAQQFKDRGFYVNVGYEPIVSVAQLRPDTETDTGKMYKRHEETTRKIANRHTKNVLIVAHGSNLHSCTQALTEKRRVPEEEDMIKMFEKIPYCSVVAVENHDKTWTFVEPQMMPFSHGKMEAFDYQVVKNE